MIRKNENPDALKAGIFAIGMHVLLFAGMLFSFNWKAAHPVLVVTEVELWDKLPASKVVEEPKPEPKPEIKEEPKPEPKPVVEDKPKIEEPKVDIDLEKEKREQDRKEAVEKVRKEQEDRVLKQKKFEDQRNKEALEKLKQEMRNDELPDKKASEQKLKEALKKLQQEALSEENALSDKQASAANASEISKYTDKIQAKIRSKVNKTLCAEGNPELRFEINLLPTGELSSSPKITKSSGSSACDDAVERAIIASEPLPLPSDPSLFSNFRNLKLIFKPND